MLDLRPVGYVLGLLVGLLGLSMLVPMAFDLVAGDPHWAAFLESGVITAAAGGFVALACANGVTPGLTIRQTFLLASGVWLVLPLFGALPFVLGATEARGVDAMFEAMSGMTTTGATVFTGLENLPPGLLVWRSMLQWFGGIGIIVVAMVFLPELKVGGMQVFRSEAFETEGKVLPRAAQIAGRISGAYLALTVACHVSYMSVGLSPFDAFNHALTTVSTGGFSTYDASFGVFKGLPEYVAALFMVLASLPFVRYVQLMAGSVTPMWHDSQIRAFLITIGAMIGGLTLWRVVLLGDPVEPSVRETLFNLVSVISGTGYASTDYQLWGTFPLVAFFLAGLVGGCAGSTTCSIKIFRYQLLFAVIRAQIRTIHSPHGVFQPRYNGKPVTPEILFSVMAFFTMFLVALGVFAILLGATGLDTVTAISGAAAALGNIGPGLGPVIGPAGNFQPLNDAAKWLLVAAMYLGRLELMVVLVLFLPRFWRAA